MQVPRGVAPDSALFDSYCYAISPGALTRMTSNLGLDDDFVKKLDPAFVSPAVDEVSSVGDFAAERDGVAWPRRAKAAVALRKLSGNAEKAHSVGCFGKLPDDTAR